MTDGFAVDKCGAAITVENCDVLTVNKDTNKCKLVRSHHTRVPRPDIDVRI